MAVQTRVDPKCHLTLATQAVLGEKALQGTSVMVHPFLVAGWAGLVSTSLNLLPVGSIDGGRIVQVSRTFRKKHR